ncbi:hypothetical protein D3C75_1120540 [compost metagenome]
MIGFFGIPRLGVIGIKDRPQALRRNPLAGIRHDNCHILFFNLGGECDHTFLGMIHSIRQ